MAYPISDVPRRIVYSGSAGVGPYAFTFEVLANTDIAVYKNTTLLTLTTDYTVSINTGTGTGTVTLVVAATGADTVTIVGDRAIQRTSDFVTGGDLFANTLNNELDAQTIYTQQVDEKADRAIRSPVTDPTTISMVLPSQASRAQKLLGFNASGEPTTYVTTTTVSDTSLINFTQAGTGAVTRTAQAKMRDVVSVLDFGAVGNGVASDATAIQNAINAVNAGGGGKVYFPQGKYNLGTTGLTVYGNVILCGEVTRYAGSTTRGTSLIYTGSGNAIYGENITDLQILDIDLDCTGSTGTYPNGRGIYLNGVWKTTLRNVTVRGVTPAKGYSIALDTNPDAFGPPSPANAWGSQHNYLEQCETSDGTVLFLGTGGSDGVTTTVCNTIRGYQYEIASSQVVFINSTAEGSSGIGFDFYGAGCFGLMLGCDIEGTLSNGIRIDNLAEVREIGTIWAGFSGATRVNGNMASLRSYGGPLEWIRALSVATAVQTAQWGDVNTGYLRDWIYPENVTGGSQSGYRYWERRINGTILVDHNWRQHAFIEKAISTASTSAATIFTIPVPSGQGLRLSAHATGIQTGDNWYSNTRDCVVMNAAGALTITQGTQLTAGSTGAITFTASGSNLLVQWTPTTANASTGTMNLEIRGPWTGYT